MIKNIFLIFFIVLISTNLYAQSSNKKKYQEAQYRMENQEYIFAIELYEELINSNPENYDLHTNIGFCLLHTYRKYEAISHLEKATNYYIDNNELKKGYAQEALYILGEAYYTNYLFEEAKKTFENLLEYSNKKQKELINKRIADCNFAKNQIENPLKIFVMKSFVLNSDYPDYCPIVTADQSKLIFTSRRNGTTGGNKDYDNLFFEDIYVSNKNQGVFSPPENMSTPINTKKHEAATSISADGTEIFIYRSSIRNAGDIYFSQFDGNNWTIPERMKPPINSHRTETHASLSADGTTLFFTSNRRKGEGGLDIYTAELADDGSWTNVQNIGETINTDQNEESPVLSFDGQTLYFSSQGHQGMGGYDVFKSTKQDNGSWSEPENLGFPLNTVEDDIFFVPTTNPVIAYYSSKQYTGISSIYLVQMYENNNNLIFVKGYAFDSNEKKSLISNFTDDSVKVGNSWFSKNKTFTYSENDTLHIRQADGNNFIDSICKIPLNTKITTYDISKNEISGVFYAVKHKGEFGVSITPPTEHLVLFESENHIYDILEIKPIARIINYNAELDTIICGQVEAIKYTKFEENQVNFSDYQSKEFDILSDFLNKYPDLYIDISSYGLSETPEIYDIQRTQQITNYLLDKNVNPNQIYNNLSTNTILGDMVEYTFYDSLTIKKAIENKQDTEIIASQNTDVLSGVLVKDITFAINRFENPEFYTELDAVAEYLINNIEAKIGIYGYTDTLGDPNYNKKLSEKRANFVKNYLIQKGANPNQIVADGKGFSKQISKNKDNDGNYIWESLAYNRRVEIVVLNQGENERLVVKPVEVPEIYALKDNNNPIYSLLVIVSKDKLESEDFYFNVWELKSSDGFYNYICGEYDTEQQARNLANSISTNFPNAYVFINNYRK